MILDINQKKQFGKHILEISCFDEQGKVKILRKEFSNLDGWRIATNVGKKEFQLDWNGRKAVKTPISRMTKFDILDKIDNEFTKDEQELVSAVNYPNYISFDIETEYVDDFLGTGFGKGAITAIALALPQNSLHKKNIVNVLATKKLNYIEIETCKKTVQSYLSEKNLNWDFKYSYYETESDMLRSFVNNLTKVGSLCFGWNSDFFDYPYIKKRCEILGISLDSLSPTKEFDKRSGKPLHFGFYDYLEVYKKYDRSVAIKESNKLDYVAEKVLGLKKLSYHGSLQSLYENDPVKYFAYNAIDAVLVMEIHNKIQTINTPLMMSAINNMSLYKATSFINLTEHLMYREYANRGLVIAEEFKKGVRSTYEGAYVKEPIPGIKKWLTCFDFSSLYPSIGRLCNMSPETFVTKVKKGSSDYHKYKKDENFIVCASGAVFKKTAEASVLKAVFDNLFAARKYYQKRAKAIALHLSNYGILI